MSLSIIIIYLQKLLLQRELLQWYNYNSTLIIFLA